MKKELENILTERYPFMRRKIVSEEQRNNFVYSLYDNYGCDIGNGWFSVIDGLCAEITAAYEKADVPVDLVPAQIKEKFGTLRFYYDIKGKEKSFHAIDFMGSGGIRFSTKDTPLYKEISDIVRKWEDKSAYVCEKCGKEGLLRRDLPWVKTLCEECYQKRIAEYNQSKNRVLKIAKKEDI